MVERRCSPKHSIHACDLGRVPLRDVRVELSLVLKKRAHVCDLRHVPLVHLICPGSPAVCAAVAARHARGIDSETAIYSSLERGSVRKRRGECIRDARDHEHRKKNQPDFHF